MIAKAMKAPIKILICLALSIATLGQAAGAKSFSFPRSTPEAQGVSSGAVLDLVEALDQAARRFNVVRALAIAFAVYGVIRIIYVVAYGTVQFQNSPLSQLIAKIIH